MTILRNWHCIKHPLIAMASFHVMLSAGKIMLKLWTPGQDTTVLHRTSI